ncbi:MAG: hypothetical protein JXR07_13930 [Reichenbachiella sp.]
MAKKVKTKSNFKVVPDWNLPEGKSKKEEGKVRVHPYALISYVQKKWGIIKASEIAVTLLNKKYNRRFEESKVVY